MRGVYFVHEGERFQVEMVGPVTCLCYCLADNKLWRFETEELAKILTEKINAA